MRVVRRGRELRAGVLILGLSCGALRGTEADACRSFLFEDVTQAAGVSFVHDRGAVGEKHFTEPMGSGLAWLDYDGDGWQDLFLVQSGPFPPAGGRPAGQLFRNTGEGRFEPVTAGIGDLRGYGQGVVAADVDGDGAVDLYLTNFGADALYRNDGSGGFREVAAEAGLGADLWSSSGAFADADLDGDLDLYVARYVRYDDLGLECTDAANGERVYCGPDLFEGEADVFYENLGDGRFQSREAGFTAPAGRGLGVLFVDLDGDRLPEVYVANDLNPNLLYRNAGSLTFEEVGLISGAAVNRDGKPEAGMGVAIADVDGNEYPDLAVTNFDVETNTLYINEGDLFFSDRSARSGFGPPSFNYLAFGLVAEDFNGDGAVDFYVANGHIFDRPERENITLRQPDLLLLGNGTGQFRLEECAEPERKATVARGAGSADFDSDGDADLAVQENGGPARLLRNRRDAVDWIGVVLRGAEPNTQAIGARLSWSREGRTYRDWQTAGDSYQSSSDPRRLFAGVGAEGGSLRIDWPCRGSWRLLKPPRGRYLIVPEGTFRCAPGAGELQ